MAHVTCEDGARHGIYRPRGGHRQRPRWVTRPSMNDDGLPHELYAEHLLPQADVAALLLLAATSRTMRTVVGTYLRQCVLEPVAQQHMPRQWPLAQATLAKVAVLPAVMFVCYLGLILYFRSRGGYRPVEVHVPSAPGVIPG